MDPKEISCLKSNYNGCGHSKAEALLSAFDSVENIENASYEELEAVDTVGKTLAKRIARGETQDPSHFDYPRPDDVAVESRQQELAKLIEDGSDQEIINLFKKVLDWVCPKAAKQAQIGLLIHIFGEVPDAELIGKAASGADPVYVRRFVWDEYKNRVVLQDNAAQRRIEQVDMERRKRTRKNYDKCVGCGGFEDDTTKYKIHHINPVDNEGSAEDSNLALLCPECHSEIHNTGDHGGVVYDSEEKFWGWAELDKR